MCMRICGLLFVLVYVMQQNGLLFEVDANRYRYTTGVHLVLWERGRGFFLLFFFDLEEAKNSVEKVGEVSLTIRHLFFFLFFFCICLNKVYWTVKCCISAVTEVIGCVSVKFLRTSICLFVYFVLFCHFFHFGLNN